MVEEILGSEGERIAEIAILAVVAGAQVCYLRSCSVRVSQVKDLLSVLGGGQNRTVGGQRKGIYKNFT